MSKAFLYSRWTEEPSAGPLRCETILLQFVWLKFQTCNRSTKTFYATFWHFTFKKMFCQSCCSCITLWYFVVSVTQWICRWPTWNVVASLSNSPSFSSDGHRLSYAGCLEVRGEIIRTVLCCIVYWKLCTVRSTLSWALLTVLWIGFCLTGPISLCVDYCVYVFLRCLVLLHMCCIIVTRWGGPGKIEA